MHAAGLLAVGLVAAAGAAETTGEHVFAKWCAGCHVDSPFAPGTVVLTARLGKEKAVLADRDDLPDPYVRALVRGGRAGMPSFRRTEISEPELDLLVDWLSGR